MKKLAIFLALVMLLIVAWALYVDSGITLIVNGQPVPGLLGGAIGITGVMVAWVALFCLAILLTFVLAGIGLFVLGGFVVAGLAVAWLMFPFLLFLLVPLALVWIFIALVRGTTR